MASFDEAFDVVMSHEDDARIKGKITRNDDGRYADKLSDIPEQFRPLAVQLPSGKWYYAYTRTRYGVDERAHPELRNGGFYSTMASDKAFDVAKSVFHQYWKFDAVNSQILATKLFDACINQGPGNAYKVVQQALTSLGKSTASWQWGPSMLNAVNECDEALLTDALVSSFIKYYEAVAKRKGYPKPLDSWIRRAQWVG